MTQRLFIVDVEATAPTPATGVMTEFGVVDLLTRDWFHGHLWDFHPDPDVPARPIADAPNPGFTATSSLRQPGFDGERRTIDVTATDREFRVFSLLDNWLRHFGDHRPVFVSDNPGFDFMWIACGFDSHGLRNPFGHSSRRIGDLAAGLSGNWKNASGWKKHRRTAHDHNPVHDALGNAEALAHLLHQHDQRI